MKKIQFICFVFTSTLLTLLSTVQSSKIEFFFEKGIDLVPKSLHKSFIRNFSQSFKNQGSEYFPSTAEFDIGRVKHKQLGEHSLKGNILCVRPYGLYQPPSFDIDYFNKQFTKWAIDRDLLGNKEEMAFNKVASSLVAFADFLTPNIRFGSPEKDSLLDLLSFFFVFDDFTDEMGTARSSLDNLNQATKIFENVLKSHRNIVSNNIDLLNFASYNILIKTLQKTKDFYDLYYDRYPDASKVCINEMIDYIRSISVCALDKTLTGISENGNMFFRSYTSGYRPVSEHIIMMNGINLQKEIRQHLLFKRFKQASQNAFAITNDIFSFKRELNDERSENSILTKITHGISLSDAFKQTIDFLNSEIRDVVLLGHNLNIYFPKNQQLRRYVMFLQNGIDGNLYWHLKDPRYGSVKSYFKKIQSGLPYNYQD